VLAVLFAIALAEARHLSRLERALQNRDLIGQAKGSHAQPRDRRGRGVRDAPDAFAANQQQFANEWAGVVEAGTLM
jgi:hypothetical protein